MSTLEDRIRDAFRADAETVRPEALPGPPAPPARPRRQWFRSRRRRVLIPLTAAAAVVAIVLGLSAAAPLLHGQGHAASPPGPGPFLPSAQPAVPHGPVPKPVLGASASRGVPASAAAPGVPRFYVTAYFAAGGVSHLVVQDSSTGQVVARISPPAGDFFATIAAPAGDRTFVTAIQPNSGCASQLYWFRLNAQGRPGPLVPLHVMVPGTYSETGDLAITPNGHTIGYATYLCDGEGEVGVIHLTTRQVRVWSWTGFSTPMSLSLSADGHLLAYTMFPAKTKSSGGAMILPTGAPAGSLAKHSRIVFHAALWGALSGDGASLYYCTVVPYDGGPLPRVGTLAYGTLSLADGAQRVIASWPGVPAPQCYASLDPAGRYLLVQFPAAVPNSSGGWVRPSVLDLRTGRLTGIHAPAFYGPLDIAW